MQECVYKMGLSITLIIIVTKATVTKMVNNVEKMKNIWMQVGKIKRRKNGLGGQECE